jgi:hypothetical protein
VNRKSIFDIRGANGWIIALGVVANLLWSFFTLIIAFYILDVSRGTIETVQVGLLISEFIGPFIIGWFCGWLAFDDLGSVPSTLEQPQGTGELYEYDIATGNVTYIQQLPIGIYTGADVRDEKNIYLAHFGSQENLWSGRVRLMVITVAPEP